MERFQEGNQRRRLRRAEVVAVGRHVASPLQDLANELVAGEPRRHSIERRAALAAFAAKRVAVAALFVLKDQGALTFEGRAAFEQFGGNWRAAPRIHHRETTARKCRVE